MVVTQWVAIGASEAVIHDCKPIWLFITNICSGTDTDTNVQTFILLNNTILSKVLLLIKINY